MAAEIFSKWSGRRSAAVLVLSALIFSTYRHFFPVHALSGWHYQIWEERLPRVSALVLDEKGDLLISEELPNQQGRLLKRDSLGNMTILHNQLSKPDGLVAFQGGVAISQEQGGQPVLWLSEGRFSKLFSGHNIEGLAQDGDYLYAVEDIRDKGRLMRYDAATESIEVIRDWLDEPEAIARCPDGRLYYAEKSSGNVRVMAQGGMDPIILGGLNQPGYLFCDSEGLWITEDLTHMARLLVFNPEQGLKTVLTHLRSPQTLIRLAPHRYLLAEQGRDRILLLQEYGGSGKPGRSTI